MIRFLLAGIALLSLAGCADQGKVHPLNPSVPYPNDQGLGSIGSPPIQQGSVPTR